MKTTSPPKDLWNILLAKCMSRFDQFVRSHRETENKPKKLSNVLQCSGAIILSSQHTENHLTEEKMWKCLHELIKWSEIGPTNHQCKNKQQPVYMPWVTFTSSDKTDLDDTGDKSDYTIPITTSSYSIHLILWWRF